MSTSVFGSRTIILSLVVGLPAILNSPAAFAQDANAATPVAFGEVKAVLRKHCGTCHNANEMRGGLDIMSEAAIQAGSDSGPVLVPGKPEESLLYLVTSHEADPKMPPNSPKIPQRELSILRRWIANVAADGAKVTTQSTDDETVGGMKAMAALPDTSASSQPLSASLLSTTNVEAGKVQPLASEVPIIASAFHPDEAMIALAVNRQVVFLNKETRELAGTLDFPFGEVHALTYSQDGQSLVVGGGEPGASGGFIIFDRERKPRFQWNEEFDVIQTLAISPDNSRVAVGSPKRTVRIIDVADGSEKFVIKKHTDWLTALTFSPDGLLLASGDRFGGLYLWNADTGAEFANLKEHNGTVRGIQFSKTSDHLVSASEDGFLRRFDLQSLSLDLEWNCEIGGLTALAAGTILQGDVKELQSKPIAEHFSAGRILVAGRNQTLKLFDFAGNPLWHESVTAKVVPSLSMTSDANAIFATTSSASVLCWLNDDHQLQPEVKLPISYELNAQLIAAIRSQKPMLPDPAGIQVAAISNKPATVNETTQPSMTVASSSPTLAESRKVLAETEDVLKRFSQITSQLEGELEKQELLRTRDLLRTRIASHRRLIQSLNDYRVETTDTAEWSKGDANSTASQLTEQLKATIEKDLSELEAQLSKVTESLTRTPQ